QLESLAAAEFGRVPIVRQTAWAMPDWSFQSVVDGELACFYNLVLREARFDGQPVPLAGVNNLITLPLFRGLGLASRLLEETEAQWFDRLAARCGLLLCADSLLPFYSKLGWQRVESEVRFEQPGGQRVWMVNCMVLTPDRSEVEPAKIDLCGLPW
ncbi:MAG: GNAT family N-acetyltransferase, partial [Acidobacteriota bacterium]